MVPDRRCADPVCGRLSICRAGASAARGAAFYRRGARSQRGEVAATTGINHLGVANDGEQYSALAPAIYQRTDGNALFMVNVVDYLVAQGPQLDASKIETPRNIPQMIERNLRRLDAEERTVLESASVAGAEFSAASVAAALRREVGEIETCCTRLARNEQFIRSHGASRWPDGTASTRSTSRKPRPCSMN